MFRKSVSRPAAASKKKSSFRPSVEVLECREVLSTTTLGVQDWGAQTYAPYVNVAVTPPDQLGYVNMTDGRRSSQLDYVQSAAGAHTNHLVLGFIDADSQGNICWDGDSDKKLAPAGAGNMDPYSVDIDIQTQVDLLRKKGGDVMISFGGAISNEGVHELASDVVLRMGTGPDALKQLVKAYQQVIDAYHLTHIDFDIEGNEVANTAANDLRSQALAQLQKNNPGLQVQFTLAGAIPQDSRLVFGISDDADNPTMNALPIVESAFRYGVNIANVNLMTMDFSNGVDYFDDTPVNHQLYDVPVDANNGHYGYAGNDWNERVAGAYAAILGGRQQIQNVADVAELNAYGEFLQLKKALMNQGKPDNAQTDAQAWRMVGITPEVGRNFTSDGSSVIFSLQDAQTVTDFAKAHGVGGVFIWSINRDQPGQVTGSHFEDNSSVAQDPYAFSKIFAAIQAPTVATPAHALTSPVTSKTTTLSVLGASAGNEANLSYTWTTISAPAAVTFSANGTNAAKDTTATFSKAGTYIFQVTIKDAGGLSTTSSVTVTVKQTLAAIAVTPNAVSLTAGSTKQLTASARDQFGNTMTTQPALTWHVSGGGTISPSGLFTAPAGAVKATVWATSGNIASTSSVVTTTAPSLTILNVYLTDVNGKRLDRLVAGMPVYVQVEFLTQDLPVGVSYVISQSVNGEVMNHTINWGAGVAGTGQWVHRWGGFRVPKGVNVVNFSMNLMGTVQTRTFTVTVPAPSLSILNVYLTDVNGKRLDNPAAGTLVYVQAEFRTQDLAVFTTYAISQSVNGSVLNHTVDWGAGTPGTGQWVHRWGAFRVAKGVNVVNFSINLMGTIQTRTFNVFA